MGFDVYKMSHLLICMFIIICMFIPTDVYFCAYENVCKYTHCVYLYMMLKASVWNQ